LANNALYAIFGILTAIWLLVLVGTVLIFHFIVPLTIFHSFLDSITKAILATILVLVWLGAFIGLTNAFVRKFILTKARAE
jgi:hypothetical protein